MAIFDIDRWAERLREGLKHGRGEYAAGYIDRLEYTRKRIAAQVLCVDELLKQERKKAKSATAGGK
jgi:hypothetical protein